MACVPVLDLREVGLSSREVFELKLGNRLDALGDLLDPASRTSEVDVDAPPKLRAVALWKSGCAALAAGQAPKALADFERAFQQTPDAMVFELSRLLTLISLKRWQDVDDARVSLHARFQGDPRYSLTAALAGAQRDDLGETRAWLDPVAT